MNSKIFNKIDKFTKTDKSVFNFYVDFIYKKSSDDIYDFFNCIIDIIKDEKLDNNIIAKCLGGLCYINGPYLKDENLEKIKSDFNFSLKVKSNLEEIAQRELNSPSSVKINDISKFIIAFYEFEINEALISSLKFYIIQAEKNGVPIDNYLKKFIKNEIKKTKWGQ